MKSIVFTALVASVFAAGCTSTSFLETGVRVGADYLANGHVGEARAHIYADKTLVEYDGGETLSFRDPQGAPIHAEFVGGRYYRLDRLATHFFADSRSRTLQFVVDPVTRVFSVTGVRYVEGSDPSSLPVSVPRL